MGAYRLEQRFFAEALAGAAARVAQSIGEEHEQILIGIPRPTGCDGMFGRHAEWWRVGGESLAVSIRAHDEGVRMTRVRIQHLTARPVDDAVERRNEHLRRRELVAHRRE